MPSNQWKTPQQLFIESLCRGIGTFIFNFFLFLFLLSFLILQFIDKMIHLQAAGRAVWRWWKTSRLAIKTQSVCRALYSNVSPLAAVFVLCIIFSFPMMVGATLQQDDREIGYFFQEMKSLVTPYLSGLSFLAGVLITYFVPKLLRGYDTATSSSKHIFPDSRSVIDLIGDHVNIPGDFPLIPSNKIIDGVRDFTTAKKQEIASLHETFQVRDQELADLLAQKDDQISQLRGTVQQCERRVTELQADKQQALTQSLATRRPAPVLTAFPHGAKELQDKLQNSTKRAVALEEKAESMGKETVNLKKEVSDLRAVQQQKVTVSSRPKNPVTFLLPSNDSTVVKEHQDEIASLNAQITQRDQDLAMMRQEAAANDQKLPQVMVSREPAASSSTSVNEYRDQIASLEAQVSQGDQNAATFRQAAATAYEQRVGHLETQLSTYERDAAHARQIIVDSCGEEVSRLQTQITEQEAELARAQAEVGRREGRLAYLESQCVKADGMYQDYVQLVQQYNLLKERHESSSHGRVNALQGELRGAQQRIAELAASKRELEVERNAPLQNPLVTIALADKDKQLAKARQVIDTLNERLVDTQRTGGTSTASVSLHESLQKDRRALRAKVKSLELRFYALLTNAKKVQERERSVTVQLARLQPARQQPPPPPISLYEQGAEMTVLEMVQGERDELFQQVGDLGARSWAMVDAVLAIVTWQLEGGSEAEAEQKCADLDEVLRPRVRAMLDRLRWRLQSVSAEARLLQGQLDTQLLMQQSSSTGLGGRDAAAKRKGRDGEEEDQARPKRQQS